jgi:hypothetical protein
MEAVQRQPETQEIRQLQDQEADLWMAYREKASYAESIPATAGKAFIKQAQKAAVRAHGRHQRVLHRILLTHRLRLISAAHRGDQDSGVIF